MKKNSRLDYAYAVGRVRVLERYLVPKAVFWEAAEEMDFAGALKVVFDAGHYPEEMIKIKNSEELDLFLDKEEQQLFRTVEEICLDKDFLKLIVGKCLPCEALALAERTGNTFIRDYVRHRIDLANLKIFARVKYMQISTKKYEELLIEGGFVQKPFLIQGFDLSLAEFGEKLQATSYREIWDRSMDVLEEEETFVEMERSFEDFLMFYLRKSKQIVFGPEPVITYGIAKQRELALIRLLGVGMMNQVPAGIIKNRMSETYV